MFQSDWTYQDLAVHAGMSCITMDCLLHGGQYGRANQRWWSTVRPRTASAIIFVIVGPDRDMVTALTRFLVAAQGQRGVVERHAAPKEYQ